MRKSVVRFASVPVAALLISFASPLRAEVITIPEEEPLNDHCPGQSVGGATWIHPAAVDDGFDSDYFSFSANAGDPITVGTTDPGGYPYSNTIIDLFHSNCTTILASDGDSGPGRYSLIYRYIAPTTGRYHLRIRGAYSSHSQPYDAFVFVGDAPAGACCLPTEECALLDRVECGDAGGIFFGEETDCAEVQCPSNPPNDTCEEAIRIPVPGSGQIGGTTAFAGDDYDPWAPSCTGLPAAGKDLVFVMDLEPGDIVDLEYLQVTANASFYIVTDCEAVSASCVAGADAAGYAESERILYVAGTPPPGACCYEGWSCAVLPERECAESGGMWRGVWTDCDPNYCYLMQGACCFPDGACIESDPWQCPAMGGEYLGDGILCYWQPCPRPPGACCFADGSCTWVDGQDCILADGLFLGEGTICDPNPCGPQIGACCFEDGRCEILSPVECAAAAGEFQGSLVSCDEVACGMATGACCLHDGWCRILTPQQCAVYQAQYFGDGVPCDPNPCPASKKPPLRARREGENAYFLILDSSAAESGGDWTLDYTITRPAGIQEKDGVGSGRPLPAARPNPSAGAVHLHFVPPAGEAVRIEIFDAGGRVVRRFPLEVTGSAGEVVWDGSDDDRARVPAGVYFLRVGSGLAGTVTPIVRLK